MFGKFGNIFRKRNTSRKAVVRDEGDFVFGKVNRGVMFSKPVESKNTRIARKISYIKLSSAEVVLIAEVEWWCNTEEGLFATDSNYFWKVSIIMVGNAVVVTVVHVN